VQQQVQRAARRSLQQHARAAQIDVQQQVQDAECARVDPLLAEPSLDPSTWKAPRPDLASDIKDAYRFSQYMQDHLPLHVCAVCGAYHGAAEVVRQSTQGLPMELLRRDGPQTDELPRSGLTVCRIGGVDYCLAHEGVLGGAAPTFVLLEPAYKLVRAAVFDQQHVDLHVCKDNCLAALQRNKVPRYLYVSFDAGRVPDVPNLLPLSPVEELMVAPLRVNRLTVIARSTNEPRHGRTRDTYQSYIQGHVLAVPNVPLATLDTVVTPLHPDALADMVDVVLLLHAKTAEMADDIAKRVRSVQVRPKVIVAWVKWLQVAYSSHFPDVQLHTGTAALSYYEDQHQVHVPVSVRQQSRFVEDERAAAEASAYAEGVRAGYANVAGDAEHAVAAQVATLQLDFDVDAPLVTEQLSADMLDRILHVWPCPLHLPERQNPAAPDVVLGESNVMVNALGGASGFLGILAKLPLADASQLYTQLDHHIKFAVKQHQMSLGSVSEHMAGIEDVSVVVDVDRVVHAQLPGALQAVCDAHRDATPTAARGESTATAVSAAAQRLVGDPHQIDPSHGQGDEGTTATAEETLLDKVRRVFLGENATGRVGIVAADSKPFSEYDKRWPALAHPPMYPYGSGMPPAGMSYDAWLPVILQRAPREQYAQQPMFVLDMFNVTQRQQVNMAARHVLQANAALFEDFSRMTQEDLVLATTLFLNKQRGKSYSEAFVQAPMVVQKFVSTLRQVGGKVRGTPAWYSSIRSQSFASWHATGPFTCFPTYNPSELHNASALQLMGFDIAYNMTAAGMGEPTNMPTMVDRWRAVAANPVACAQHFNVYRNAVWNVLYGWPRGQTGQQQARVDCRFGRIRAIVDRAEHSSRGGLHPHMLVAQADMQPARLRLLQGHADGLKQLQLFCEQLSCKHMPDGWHVAGTNGAGEAAVDFKKVPGRSKALGACYKFPIGVAHDIVSRVPSDADADWHAMQAYVREFQARLAGANQVHAHSARCQKGGLPPHIGFQTISLSLHASGH
jgi:hypothetical protein